MRGANGTAAPASSPAPAGGGGGGSGGGGNSGSAPSSPATSPAPPPSAASSSASQAMMNFARHLGLTGRSSNLPHTPATPPPADLPNPQTPNNAADTNSVFYVDDTLSELARVKRYSLSQLPLQRLVYVKRIAACARTVGLQETLTQLLPLFEKLVADQEAVVRTAASAELANISHFLADPALPWVPIPPSQPNGALNSTSSKLPTTQQSPDITLEDDQLLEIEVNDVDNHLPADIMIPLGANGVTPTQNGASSSAAVAAASNSDAMDVDSAPPVDLSDSEAPKPSSSPSSSSSTVDPDSDPMDVSTDGEVLDASSLPDEHRPTPAEVEAKSVEPAKAAAVAAHSEEVVATSPVAAIPAAAAASVSSSSSSPSSTSPVSAAASTSSAPSSPLTLSLAAPSTAATDALLHSPLNDPTSTLRMECYEQIKEAIIPCLQTLILDNNAEVRAAACDALVRVADVLRGDDVGKVVLTLVLNLAHDERDEQRTTAVHLMHELAPRLGHDLCRSFVALELAAFADDSTFRVRKATAQSFGNVCEMVGEAFTVAKLLPCYVRLSKDLIWGVRAGCVKSLVAVTRVVSAQTRQETLIPMFERFAKDSSRWVRNGAYEILGPFLYALGPSLASKELVAYYANIPTMSSAIVDQEVNFHAAFNLPAVVLTIGRERWTDELLPCFNLLIKDQKFPVRRTLAYSLHELAALLGPQLTESSLLPALDAFLRDLDEVRYGVLKTFALLLRALPPAKRVPYLEVLWVVQKQQENWRWRLLWAKQLGAFAQLFSAEYTVSDIMPLTFALCRDSVFAVRRTAAKALGRLLVRFLSFSTPNPVLGPCLADIHSFASSATYMDRQLYLRMLDGFLGLPLPPALLEECLERAVPLATDKTSNVRLACVATMRALLQHPQHAAQYHASPAAQKIVAALAQDKHREVARAMHEALHQANLDSTTNSLAGLALAAGASSAASSSVAAVSAAPSDALTDSDLEDILRGPTASAAEPSTSASTSTSGAGDAASSTERTSPTSNSPSATATSSSESRSAEQTNEAEASSSTVTDAAAERDHPSPDEE